MLFMFLCFFAFCSEKKSQESQESQRDESTDASPSDSSQSLPSHTCPEVILPQNPEDPFFVGDGTPASCTEEALKQALSEHFVVHFNCGEKEVTIPLTSQIELDQMDQRYVIDGGNRIRLNGQNQTRLIRMGQKTHLFLSNLILEKGFSEGTDLKGSGAAVSCGLRAETHIVNVTFQDNVVKGSGEVGGALYSRGGVGAKTYVINSRFVNNRGLIGGGIDNLLTDLTVIDSVFEKNFAETYGGAIYTDGAMSEGAPHLEKDGLIKICRTQFIENQANGQGGAAFLFTYGDKSKGQSDRVEVTACHFEKNKSLHQDDALGAALRVGTGDLLLESTSFFENTSANQGGGLWIGETASVTIRNSTFYGNQAKLGGAITFSSSGQLRIFNTSLMKNVGTAFAGAISGTDKDIEVYNSLFLENTAQNEWGIKNQCTDGLGGSHNVLYPFVEKEETPCFTSLFLEDPLVGEPENQGFLKSIPLGPNSPARQRGHAETCLETDQWLLKRSSPCSLGARE